MWLELIRGYTRAICGANFSCRVQNFPGNRLYEQETIAQFQIARGRRILKISPPSLTYCMRLVVGFSRGSTHEAGIARSSSIRLRNCCMARRPFYAVCISMVVAAFGSQAFSDCRG